MNKKTNRSKNKNQAIEISDLGPAKIVMLPRAKVVLSEHAGLRQRRAMTLCY